MAIDPKFVGREYGPFTYQVGLEKIREFAVAISTAPLPYLLAVQGLEGAGAAGDRAEAEGRSLGSSGLRPVYHDEAAGKASKHGSVIAPPTFCVNFALAPFLRAVLDPELRVNVAMLLHGEQEFEFGEPVRPGDVITTRGRIDKIFEKASKDFLIVETTSVNQSGKPVVRGVWTAVIRQ